MNDVMQKFAIIEMFRVLQLTLNKVFLRSNVKLLNRLENEYFIKLASIHYK